MQIVIEVSKEDYDLFKNTAFVEDEKTIFKQKTEDRRKTMALFRIIEAVRHGTVLPKHGRLIDADDYKKNLKWNENVDNAPTILEAWGNEE